MPIYDKATTMPPDDREEDRVRCRSAAGQTRSREGLHAALNGVRGHRGRVGAAQRVSVESLRADRGKMRSRISISAAGARDPVTELGTETAA